MTLGFASVSGRATRMTTSQQLNVRSVVPALHYQFWDFSRDGGSGPNFLVFVADGEAVFETQQQRVTCKGPSLCWTPGSDPPMVRFSPGGTGFLARVSGDLVHECGANGRDPGALRHLLTNSVVAELPKSEASLNGLRLALSGLEAEQQKEDPASWLLCTGYLRILLGMLVRLSGSVNLDLQGHGVDRHILLRFRELVEAHFKDHWSVMRYAEELCMTADRLHAVATRSLGRRPSDLIQDRITHEAKMLLEQSSFSIGQIAHWLGYKEVSHFSNFFTKRIGVPPGRYRANLEKLASEEGSEGPAELTFADWP